MYNRALFNQEKSRKLNLNCFISKSTEKLNSRSFKTKSQILSEDTLNKIINNKTNVYSQRHQRTTGISLIHKIENELKISTNQYNSNIQVFIMPM